MKRLSLSIVALIIMGLLFAVGLGIIFNASDFGKDARQQEILANGNGPIDTDQLNYIENSTAQDYRTSGMVISIIGGFGILLSGAGLYREVKI